MYKDYKIVVVTPAGRAQYLDILKKYIYKEMDKGLIDDWQLWYNTGDNNDISYMNGMEIDRPGKVKKYVLDGINGYDAYQIHRFFQFVQNDNTIYLRFDDDIVYIEDRAIEKLIQCRIDNPEPFIV